MPVFAEKGLHGCLSPAPKTPSSCCCLAWRGSHGEGTTAAPQCTRLDLLGEEALEALDEARQLRGGASAAAWPRKPLEAARTRTGTALSLGALAWRSCFSTFSTDSDPVIRLPRSRCSQVQHETHLPTPAPAGAAPLLQSWATILEAELHAWHCLAKRIQAVKTSLVSSYLPSASATSSALSPIEWPLHCHRREVDLGPTRARESRER